MKHTLIVEKPKTIMEAGGDDDSIKNLKEDDELSTTSSNANLLDVEQRLNEIQANKGTSDLETLMHVIKGNIGTGVLAMPLAFKNAGLALASVTLWMMGFVCVHCMHILLNCYKHLVHKYSKQNEGHKVSDTIGYDDVVELVFRERWSSNSNIPKYAKMMVSTFLVFGQLGVCCVYLVFVPTNIKQVIDFYNPTRKIPLELIMSIVAGLLLLYCLIKDLKVLAPFSTFANALMIGSMGVILLQLFTKGTFKKSDEIEMVAPAINWPNYFSTAIYAFEGIPLVLPLYHKMRNKSNYGTWNGVLNIAMIIVATIYFLIGFFGYKKYGNEAMASITLNLPVENVLFQIIKILFAIAIFISYNLQFIVAAEILWSYLFNSSHYLQSLANVNKPIDFVIEADDDDDVVSNGALRIKLPVVSRKLQIIETVFRSCLILLTFLLAICIPKIDLFINLAGAIAGANLALIIPPILEMITFWRTSKHPHFMLVKNALILLFGVYVFFAGTILSFRDIIVYIKDN